MSRPYNPEGMTRWVNWYDTDHLEAAREAAARDGLSLNDWMRQVLALALRAL